MRFSRTLKSAATVGATTALMLLGLGSASAHVDATASDSAAGSHSLLTFAVGHGCEGSSTVSVAITLPEELNSVTPTVNPNWTISTTTQKFDTPRQLADGSKISERTKAVIYTAKTPLDAHQRDTFTLSFKVPDTAGKSLYFPALQSCEKGSTDWKDIPAAGQDEKSLQDPAPSLAVTTAVASTDGHNGHNGQSSAATAQGTQADASTSAQSPLWPAWLGLGAGLLGLVLGAVALTRTRKPKETQ